MIEEELESLFNETGAVVSVKIITDFDGRHKGFGFVEMASQRRGARRYDGGCRYKIEIY